ncbi:hypothetical protein SUDANB5_00145 [Streptomyces sp. SudanB5_2050]
MLWLVPDDLTLPLHAGQQCLTTLALRNEPVDPATVLWEAQSAACWTAAVQGNPIARYYTGGRPPGSCLPALGRGGIEGPVVFVDL